ncbi:nicotinamide riboside transporter PnuC [Streptococcus iniae]|uniref:nicotinamide riboside transporter PnuC n=1 Tax=Streptococcus iniae TaxID=1346 RepID=UPI000EF66403|nr:nicotinamide riboside transporter PnuC [Streptococcus iniae]RLV44602.1 nicotinamide riboside transporter PnuC [Streptococcus iniae]
MSLLRYFTKTEWVIWLSSLMTIFASHLIFGSQDPLALTASLIGATSLIFSAKGNPIGQGLIIIFSVIYSYLSYQSHYYGELFTYLLMTLPMAIFSLFSWLTHPFEGRKSQVLISRLKMRDICLLVISMLLMTFIFYFILGIFHKPYLTISTLSIATSFAGTFLTYKRSPFFALGFCLNDIVLIILWLFEAQENANHYAIVICFAIFLINDIYTFFNWLRLQSLQEKALKNRLGNLLY